MRALHAQPSELAQRVGAGSLRSFGPATADVVSLAIGDPDMATPPHIVQAQEQAVRQGYTHYADRPGDPELRAALAQHMSQRYNTESTPDQVLITHGSSAALAAAILGTLNPGDKLLVPEPTYSLYADIARFAGAEPVFVPHLDNLHLDLDRIEQIAPACRMLVLCTPCNPTGVVYSRQELADLGRICASVGLLVLTDEAYDRIVFDGVQFTSAIEIPELRERLIYCQSFSKTYAMTGWRLGYLHAAPQLVAAATTVHQTINGAVNTAVQRAALAALSGPMDWLEQNRVTYQRRRDIVLEHLAGAEALDVHRPDGTFYAYVRSRTGASAGDMIELCARHGVLVRPGTEFGPSGRDAVRLSYSVADSALTEGLTRLVTALS